MPVRSTRDRALRSPTTHSFRPGRVYREHGAAEQLPLGPHRGRTASPPPGTPDGTDHVLGTPGGDPMIFTWVGGVWARPGGRRMAFTPSHLGEHGWTYCGPA